MDTATALTRIEMWAVVLLYVLVLFYTVDQQLMIVCGLRSSKGVTIHLILYYYVG